ncbi:MAG: glycoside hydrolase family 16 protein [Planctomycetota bacterium]
MEKRPRLPGLMWAVLALSLLLLVARTANAAPDGWDLVWNDEFDGSSLDRSKWDPILWMTPENNEWQAYLPEQVSVSGGNLVLSALEATPQQKAQTGKPYVSGKVESTWTKQYGRWEVRAKLPGTRGTWPAIWLLPDTETYRWPSQGEIDIMENRGDEPLQTSSAYHWGPNWEARKFLTAKQQTSIHGRPQNYHDQFHTYAVEWDASKLRFFVDDVHHWTLTDESTSGFLSSQAAVMETVLNVAVGGDFVDGAQPGPGSTWPQQMLVDYVRVYERAANPPPAVFTNGGFEARGGGLAGWSTFGNTFPNVQVHQEAVSEGGSSLKFFGQFSAGTNYSGVSQGISLSPGDRVEASLKAFVPSADSIAGTGNQVIMKFDYFSEFGGVFGTAAYISSTQIVVADGTTPSDEWADHVLTGTAPAGAVEARLALVFVQNDSGKGSVHLDAVTCVNQDLERGADDDADADLSHGIRGRLPLVEVSQTAPAGGD